MKKFAFTLAEVLISLGIIGIIAALSLPGLKKASQQASIGSQLAKTLSAIEEATGRLVLEYQDVPLEELENFNSKLGDHLIMESCDGGYKLKDGVVISISNSTSGTIPETAVGSVFKRINVDLNGATGPNTDGVDKFHFVMTTQGFVFPQGKAKLIQENNWKVPKDYN